MALSKANVYQNVDYYPNNEKNYRRSSRPFSFLSDKDDYDYRSVSESNNKPVHTIVSYSRTSNYNNHNKYNRRSNLIMGTNKIIFKKGSKSSKKLRMLISGQSGSGKTLSSLLMAKGLSKAISEHTDKPLDSIKIAVFDTEVGRSSLKIGNPLIKDLEWDVFEWDIHEMQRKPSYSDFIDVIHAAEEQDYDILIIDSVTPEWEDINERHSRLPGNSFINWGKVKAEYHNQFLNAFVYSKCHIILTARSKMEYVLDEKGKPQKVGLGTQQDSNLPYICDFVFNIQGLDHFAIAEKDETNIYSKLESFIITDKVGYDIGSWLFSLDSRSESDDSRKNRAAYITKLMLYQDQLVSLGVLTEDKVIPESKISAMSLDEITKLGKSFAEVLNKLKNRDRDNDTNKKQILDSMEIKESVKQNT